METRKHVQKLNSPQGLLKLQEFNIPGFDDIGGLKEKIELGEFKSSDISTDMMSPEDYISFVEHFGSDALANLDDVIQQGSRNIALGKVLGPNHKMGFEQLLKSAQETQPEFKGVRGTILKGSTYNLKNEYNVVSGLVDRTADASVNVTAAKYSGAIRAANTAGLLGNVIFASTEDLGTALVSNKEFGISFGQTIKNVFGSFSTKSHKEVAELGYGLDIFQSEMNNRFSENGAGWAQKASDVVMWASFIQRWSESVKNAFIIQNIEM